MSDYQVAGLKHPDAPCNQPDYEGTYCEDCGLTILADPDGPSEFWECAAHYEYSDPETQDEIFAEILRQRDELIKADEAKRKEIETLKSRLRYQAGAFGEIAEIAAQCLERNRR